MKERRNYDAERNLKLVTTPLVCLVDHVCLRIHGAKSSDCFDSALADGNRRTDPI